MLSHVKCSGIYGTITINGTTAIKVAKDGCKNNNLLEYSITSKIDCPYVIKHVLSGTDLIMDAHPTLVLNKITEDELEIIIKQLVIGINAIHETGYVHMDMKPSNVLYDKCAIIIDLGVAHKIGDSVVKVVGSRHFRPPEVYPDTTYTVQKSHDYWSIGMFIYSYYRKPFKYIKKSVSHSWLESMYIIFDGPADEAFVILDRYLPRHIEEVAAGIQNEYLNKMLVSCLQINPLSRRIFE